MTREEPAAPCPVSGCDAALYLTITSCVPIYTQDPPWPGAGDATYDAQDAVSQGWQVECEDGHVVWGHADQIRADNAAGRTDDDETADYAPTFRYAVLETTVLRSAS